jgi:RNA polymerase sigma factor (sigma-70 family)
MEETSAELLDRYRQGDSKAADALFARYVERLTELVRWQIAPRLRKRIDPEDAVHSAYRSFFIRARSGDFVLQRSGELWKLLVAMTLNKLRRQIVHHQSQKRSVRRDRSIEEPALPDLSVCPSPLEALAAADELESLMRKLSPLERTVLELRLQEHRWDEIAQATGRSERTVRRVLEGIRVVWRQSPELNGAWPTSKRDPSREQPETVASAAATSVASRDASASLDYRDFKLNEYIGSGGAAKVYRAWQNSASRQVAVKMLRKSRWNVASALERFLEEARVVAALQHPGIVKLHGAGYTPGGGLFISMEFIEGCNLEEAMQRQRPTTKQAVAWIAEVAAALDVAHQHGVIHCDLKPSNLFREEATGRIVLGDFGVATSLAAPSGSKQWAGTLGFMAPEQLDSAFGDVGPATDIFGLGLVLHYLITGRKIFEGKRILEALARASQDDSDWLRIGSEGEISLEIREILVKSLELEPSRRIASAGELSQLLFSVSRP